MPSRRLRHIRPCVTGLASGITGWFRLGTDVRKDRRPVPTLFRFIAFLAIVGGLIFGGMIALVTFVQPEPREMVEIVPPAKLQPR